MAAAYVDHTTWKTTVYAADPSFEHVAPAGDNRLLLLFVTKEANPTIAGITYDGNALTKLTEQDGNYSGSPHFEAFYKVLGSGEEITADIAVTESFGFQQAGIHVVNLTSVNQEDPFGTTEGTNDDTDSDYTISLDITTDTANSLLFGCAAGDYAASAPFSGNDSQTERWDEETGGSGAGDFGMWGAELAAPTAEEYSFGVTSNEDNTALTLLVVEVHQAESGETHYGAASVTGVGSVSAAAVITAVGAASVAGAGSVSAAAVVTATGTAAVTGVGSVSAAAVADWAGTAAVTGAGSIAAAAVVTVVSTASVTGVGSVAAAGTKTHSGAASVTGAGSIAGLAAMAYNATASVTGTGAIAALAVMLVVGSASVTGVGTAAGVAVTGHTHYGTASVTGVASAVAAGDVTQGGDKVPPAQYPSRDLQIQARKEGPSLAWIPVFPTDEAPRLSNAMQVFRDWILNSLSVAWIRVGDYLWDNNGDIEVHGFTMATDAEADQVLTADADGVGTWEDAVVTEPAGSDTEVQYNDDGEFGAEAAFTYDPDTNTLTVTNAVVVGELQGGRCCFTACKSGTSASTSYLKFHGITMDSDHGHVMPRAGSIVSVSGLIHVVNSSGGALAKVDVLINDVLRASTDNVDGDIHIGDHEKVGQTKNRGVEPFSALDVLSFKITLTGSIVVSHISGVADVQFDT